MVEMIAANTNFTQMDIRVLRAFVRALAVQL